MTPPNARAAAVTVLVGFLAFAGTARAAVPAYWVTIVPNMQASAQSFNGYAQINKWGQVVGRTLDGHPALFTPDNANGRAGVTRDLSLAPGYPAAGNGLGTATAINQWGEVVGNAFVGVGAGGDSNGEMSFIFRTNNLNTAGGLLHSGHQPGNVTLFPLFYDGSLLAEYPSSINGDGQILGHGADYQPLLFQPNAAHGVVGGWIDLAPPLSFLGLLNDAGQIAGNSQSATPSQNGAMLAASPGAIAGATAIVPNPQIWDTTQSVNLVAINQHGDLLIDATPAGGPLVEHVYLMKAGQQPVDLGAGFGAGLDDAGSVVANMGQSPLVPTLIVGGVQTPLLGQLPKAFGTGLAGEQLSVVTMNSAGQMLASDGVVSGVLLLTPRALVPPSVQAQCQPAVQNGAVWTEQCRVVNNSTVARNDLSIAFDNCAPVALVGAGAAGATLFAAPAGSPVFDFPAGTQAPALGGMTALSQVTFNANPAACTPRALAGAAPR